MYYSKDVPKFQFLDVPYIPTKEKGHDHTTCTPTEWNGYTKLEVEAFINQCKRIVASRYKKSYLTYKLETLCIKGVNRRYMRIGYQPDEPASLDQLKLIVRLLPDKPVLLLTNWDKEAIRYLSLRNYKFLQEPS